MVSLSGLLTGTLDEVLAQAKVLRMAGYTVVKLKTGRDTLDADIQCVRALRSVLGPDIQLRLDANRAWSMEAAIAFMRGIQDVDIEYIEEPLQAPEGLETLARRHGVPVALDETLAELGEAALMRHTYARAIILKPMLLGGLRASLHLARRAHAAGIRPVASAAFETGIGLLGVLALAASSYPEDIPAGLDTYRFLAADVLQPPLVLQACKVTVRVPATPPARHRVDRASLRKIFGRHT